MKKNNINLIFQSNEAGEDEGLGHAGIETYRDAPYASVARECGQNSRDAVLKDPVVMSFDLLRIPTGECPIRNEHRQAVQRCLEKARKKGDEKEIEFFE
jgi:hypothetical protein